MYAYPPPAPDIDDQFQPLGAPYNRPVANSTWAVPGSFNAINTNVDTFPQYEFTSPMVTSSSTSGYPSSNLALLPRDSFDSEANFPPLVIGGWPWPPAQRVPPSQSLVHSGDPQAREVLARKLRALIRLLLSTRVVLRNVRRRNRRHSVSGCRPSPIGFQNATNPSPTSNPSYSDVGISGILSNEYQAHLNFANYSNDLQPDNTPGIWNSGQNSLFSTQADIPREVTELSEEHEVPGIDRELPGSLATSVAPENVVNRTQRRVSRSKRSKKRPIGCMELDESSGDDIDEGLKESKRHKGDSTELLFACPFYKHDPVRHGSTRTCVGPGWDKVHRIKEHVFRKHRLPEHQCSRCFDTFESSEDLSQHSRSPEPCQLQNRAARDEGISLSQEKELRTRPKKNGGGSNNQKIQEDRWYNMYRIIFPNDHQPSSPYYDRVQLPIDAFGISFIDDFYRRMSDKLSFLAIHPSLQNRFLTIARNTLRESMRSLRQGDESPDSQHSQLTAFQPQPSQSNLGVASLSTDIGMNMLGVHDDQLLEQMLFDTNLEIGTTGSWSLS